MQRNPFFELFKTHFSIFRISLVNNICKHLNFIIKRRRHENFFFRLNMLFFQILLKFVKSGKNLYSLLTGHFINLTFNEINQIMIRSEFCIFGQKFLQQMRNIINILLRIIIHHFEKLVSLNIPILV